jgi:uncharacterized cupin superfamily protein
MLSGYPECFCRWFELRKRSFITPYRLQRRGFGFVRCKPGEGATYVHRQEPQEEVFITLKGTGSIVLDGKRISMPGGTMIRIAPKVYRALGNDRIRMLSI